MPLYDFRCPVCEERFETRVPQEQRPACPACGLPDAERLPTAFAGPFRGGLRGAAAKRSNAIRRTREEQRRERTETRRERKARGE